MEGGQAKIVISDCTYNTLLWIKILDDFTMDHYHETQPLKYCPSGPYTDLGELIVRGGLMQEIHRYSCDGHLLEVINLLGDIAPWGVTRLGEDDTYVTSDPWNSQIVLINNEGQVRGRYKGEVHGIKLEQTFGVISSSNGALLVADNGNHQVLMLNMEKDEVKLLLHQKHVSSPVNLLYQLYVSGKDQSENVHVFVFDYQPINRGKSFKQKIIKLDLSIQMGEIK